jgi:polysaccharide biosynthesis transport protein
MNVTDVSTIELSDYWLILKRRKLGFLVPFGVVLGVSVALAFLLPPSYRSEATILIQRQSIPSALVKTTVNTYVEEQIQEIKQRITSHDNLLSIAESFGLYASERQSAPARAVSEVASSIDIEMVDVKASDPDERGDRVATIAFTVAFSAEKPETAQAVTKELADRYLDEHKAAREEQAANVSSFLEAEAVRLKDEIGKLEALQADFKQQEQNQLPELRGTNLSLLEKTEQEIETTNEAIRAEQDRLDAAQAELSLTEPFKQVLTEEGKVMLSASERLSLLSAQYLRDSARYSPEHPDIVRLSREIRVLAQQSGTGARADELMGELTKLQEQLRQMRQKYSDDHPEVIKLERSVAALERGFQSELMGANGKKQTLTMPPDNPRYVALKTQVDAATSNLSAEKQKLAMLEAKRDEYESRLFKTPGIERDYKSLSRDYENALQKYSEIKNKQLEARMAQQLESGDSAEQFVLLSRAYLPTMPDSPNRIGILLLGGLLAFGAGLGFVAVMEYLDKTVRDERVIAEMFGALPLAIIPHMDTASS